MEVKLRKKTSPKLSILLTRWNCIF